MSTTPFDIIAGPADVYVAAVGATVPGVDKADTDSSFSSNGWVKLGFTEGGVKAKHTQSVTMLTVDQRTGPVKAIRSAEGLEISVGLAQLTLERYRYALNSALVQYVDVITLTAFGGTDSFKVTYNGAEDGTAFTNGSTYTQAELQSQLRTDTGDTGLVVSAVTTGGFTITYSAGFTPATAVTITSPSGCTGATESTNTVKTHQGLDTARLALLVRGPSPYMSAFSQYAAPVVVQTDSPEVDFVKDNKAVLQCTFTALEDPNAASDDVRFGTLTAQTS